MLRFWCIFTTDPQAGVATLMLVGGIAVMGTDEGEEWHGILERT
jgi:hypothetical protein